MADRSLAYPRGVVEDVLVKVDKFIFPADFIVLDMEEDADIPLLLGRPFLATGRTLIDVQKGELTMRVQDEQVTFNVFSAMKFSNDEESCFSVSTFTGGDDLPLMLEQHSTDPLELSLREAGDESNEEIAECVKELNALPTYRRPFQQFESFEMPVKSKASKPSIEEPPELELKQLPTHLKYAFLGENSTLPVIISSTLSDEHEGKLLRVLKEYKRAIGWKIADIRGISPSFCMHKISIEDDHKPSIEHQRRLNPVMKEVV